MVIYPGDWEVKKLGEVCKISSGFMGDFRLTRGKYRITRIETIADGFIDEHKVGYSNVKPDDSFRLRFGDILYSNINSIAHIGKVAQYKNESELYHGANLLRLVPCVNVSADFLFYLLISERSRTWARINANPAVNQASINQSLLKSQEIILPPLKEQTAIAETLAAFDTHITNLTELITKKKAIRDGALDELMTGRTRLYGFCGDWRDAKIGDILKILHGKDKRNVESPTGHYPILGTGGIIGKATKPLCDWECVLIGRKGTIDRPYYMDKPFWCIDTLFYSKPEENQCVKYQYYLFCSINWYNYMESSGRPSLTRKAIENINIKLPPLDEQIAIADTLTALDTEISSLENERAKISSIRDGAINDLLTGKVRLKIGI